MIDFGLSKKYGDSNFMGTKCGTPYYVAPEVISGKYGNSCDVWGLGIILYSMLSGHLPFDGDNQTNLFNNIKNVPVPFDEKLWGPISEEAKDLVNKMLIKDHKKRITLAEAKEHNWFIKAQDNVVLIPQEIFLNMKSY